MEQKLITRQGTRQRASASETMYAWEEIFAARRNCECEASSRMSTLKSPAFSFSILVNTFGSSSLAALHASAGLTAPELALTGAGCMCSRMEFIMPVLSREI